MPDAAQKKFYERRQEVADQLDQEFSAGSLRIQNGWLIHSVEGCTCAGGTPESSYIHEPFCGWEPLIDIARQFTEGEQQEEERARERTRTGS